MEEVVTVVWITDGASVKEATMELKDLFIDGITINFDSCNSCFLLFSCVSNGGASGVLIPQQPLDGYLGLIILPSVATLGNSINDIWLEEVPPVDFVTGRGDGTSFGK